MVKYKAYKCRLYPNRGQQTLIDKTIGCARKIYNLLLADGIGHYREHKKTLKREVSYYKKLEDYSYLKEVDSLALANAKKNLEAAYKNFFKKRTQFPKFKKKGIHDSYTTNRLVGKTGCENICFDGTKLKLPKIGYTKTKCNRYPGEGETIKSVTVSKKAGKYYAAVLVEYGAEEKQIPKADIAPENCIGLDYSSHAFYMDSNGEEAGYPRYFRKSEKRLAGLQRSLARKKKGSNNRYRQKLKVQKLHQHIADQRLDFCHKKSAELTDKYDVICFENLNLSALKKSLHLGKSTSDNGFGIFRKLCEYKAERKGSYVVKAGKFFASSQLCSCCGYRNTGTKDLSVRAWTCPECGTCHDRDVNAAVNIRNEGYRTLMGMA